MYIVGEEEIDALAKVIRNRASCSATAMGSECDRFEARYADHLGVKPVRADGERHLRPLRRDDRASASAPATRC